MERRLSINEDDNDEISSTSSRELLELDINPIELDEYEHELTSVSSRKLLELDVDSVLLENDEVVEGEVDFSETITKSESFKDDLGVEIVSVSQKVENVSQQSLFNLLAIIFSKCNIMFNSLGPNSFDVFYIATAYLKAFVMGIITMVEVHGFKELIRCIRDANMRTLMIYPALLFMLLTVTQIPSLWNKVSKCLRCIPLTNWFIYTATEVESVDEIGELQKIIQNMKQVTKSNFAGGPLLTPVVGAVIGNQIFFWLTSPVGRFVAGCAIFGFVTEVLYACIKHLKGKVCKQDGCRQCNDSQFKSTKRFHCINS
ncbi:uncharacterized protein LOC119689575 [Teleopsis dalmanni]|uniref:uncharacterized protein LOC119689575 n=1 Tax=Teleopsis dalmanni TaxID=139649 RepID=UPI0018CEBF8A|nr:uncharacterized protein LOC119689575 [Teleopsis dalmanni]